VQITVEATALAAIFKSEKDVMLKVKSVGRGSEVANHIARQSLHLLLHLQSSALVKLALLMCQSQYFYFNAIMCHLIPQMFTTSICQNRDPYKTKFSIKCTDKPMRGYMYIGKVAIAFGHTRRCSFPLTIMLTQSFPSTRIPMLATPSCGMRARL